MVREGKNKNQELGKKMKRGRKKKENHTIKGEKGLKNASFWAINFAPPTATTYLLALYRGWSGVRDRTGTVLLYCTGAAALLYCGSYLIGGLKDMINPAVIK